MRYWGFLILGLSLNMVSARDAFDLQGHRGARGLAPENTFPSFVEALKNGVTTLELDVVVTKDMKILVSHDPWINKNFCTDKNGQPIKRTAPVKYNIYKMTYEEVKFYDCGSTPHPRFPHQQLQPVHKPLLSELIPQLQAYIKANNLPQVRYNIEIKTKNWARGIFHPRQDKFAELLVAELNALQIREYTIIQSFDVKPLQYLHETHPDIELSYLVENKKSFERNLKRLGFTPQIYSPGYHLVDKTLIEKVHLKGMKIIPWTINTVEEMLRIAESGVDGLITDYPDLGKDVKELMDLQNSE